MPMWVISPALAGIQHDEIADLVGRVGHDEDAGKQVGEGILGGETDGDTDDAGGCQPRGHVDVPGGEDDVHRHHHDGDKSDVLKQRQGLWI